MDAVGCSPSQGKTFIFNRLSMVREWPSVQVCLFFANHSSATASKLLASCSKSFFFVCFLCWRGSIPFLNNFLAFPCSSLASFNFTWGYYTKGESFSLSAKTVIVSKILSDLVNQEVKSLLVCQLIWLLFWLSIANSGICERHDGISLVKECAYTVTVDGMSRNFIEQHWTQKNLESLQILGFRDFIKLGWTWLD